MKMDGIERLAMDFRFCGANFEEDTDRSPLDPGRKSGGFNQLSNLREPPMLMFMRVAVAMGMPMLMRMAVAVGMSMVVMFVTVIVVMRMSVIMVVIVGSEHIQMRAADTLHVSAFRPDAPALQPQFLEFMVEGFFRNTEVNQGRQKHVAADSANEV